MRKAEVDIGGVYAVKVSGRIAAVRITGASELGKGWAGVNLATGHAVRIRTAARLRLRMPDGSGSS